MSKRRVLIPAILTAVLVFWVLPALVQMIVDIAWPTRCQGPAYHEDYASAAAVDTSASTNLAGWSHRGDTEIDYSTTKYFEPLRGDANRDGAVDIADVLHLINYLFIDGPPPAPCLDFGDANYDGEVDIGDILYLINYLFIDGPPPDETPPECLDQEMTQDGMVGWCYPPDKFAQSFTPSLDMFSRVELKVEKGGNPSGDLTISIRECPYADDLVSVSIPAQELPSGITWIQFDFPDIQVYPEEKYYIVWHPGNFNSTNWVGWRATSYDLYPHGRAWLYNGDQYQWVMTSAPNDYAFKTYGYDAEPPTAFIDDVSPNPADTGEPVTFVGHGEDPDGFIVDYQWTSSLDGLLSMDSSFSTNTLSMGMHYIDLKVQDNDSLWSIPASDTLAVGVMPDQLDQEMTQDGMSAACYPPDKFAQSFTPSLDMLSRVELKVEKGGNPSGDLTISIRDSLYADDLVSVSIAAEELPRGINWIQFDFPDIQVYPEEKYYIVWHPGNFNSSNWVGWRATSSNVYPRGEAWAYEGDQSQWFPTSSPRDFTFKTYGYDAQPPTAFIDDISPNPADTGELVTFVGHGEDPDGFIVAYQWTSSLDGLLSMDSSFSTNTLSMGMHYIGLKVQDNDSLWSTPASDTLNVGVIPDQLDQEMTQDGMLAACYPPDKFAQSFTPSLDMLSRVELKVEKGGNPSGDLTISIRDSLYADDLTSVSIPGQELPAGVSWVEFDFPDIQVYPEEKYYIVWHPGNFNSSNWVGWRATSSDLYPGGEAWLYTNDYQWVPTSSPRDYAFKTYGYPFGRDDAN